MNILIYSLSQVFIIFNYIFLGISYQSKDHKKILYLNIASLSCAGLSYICLSAYTGLAMEIISIFRNIVFLINEEKNGKTKHISKNEIYLLIVIYILIIISTIFTYDGFLSLMSVFATALYTYSVWQKNTKLYKLLGIPVSIIWLIYNIYIKSIFGIILEIILILAEIIGVIREGKKDN